MQRRSDKPENWETLRAKIIGLGEQSIQKSYYPELQRRIANLELFRALLDQSTDSILLAEVSSGHLIDVNTATCCLTGYTRDELISKTLTDLFPDSAIEEMRRLFLRKPDEGKSVTITCSFFRTDGVEMPLEMTVSLVYLKESVYAVLVGRDITERLKAQERLKESEERYRTLFDNVPVGLFRSTSSGQILDINNVLMDITGLKDKEGLQDLNENDFYVDHGDRMRFIELLERDGVVRDLEVPMKKDDGSVIWGKISARVVKYLDEKPLHIEGTIEDITERRKAEEEKKKLEGRLRQAEKLEALGTVSGGIAHDFNNILSAIIGYSSLALRDIPNFEKVRDDLQEVIKSGNRAADLVKQILLFSRKTEIEYAPVMLRSVVSESLKMLRSILPSTIEIRHDLAVSGFIMSDPTQINQILLNLCTNAAHAMDAGGGVLSVRLERVDVSTEAVARGLRAGPYMKLIVSDTGEGMAPETVERIFDPYFTTKKPGRGTGLGLSVVHGIVENHCGVITCESTPGIGTTFTICIPEISAKKTSVEASKHLPYPTGTEKILYVDDEPTLTGLVAHILGNLGYEVTTMTNSLQALELLKAEPERFDMVITDMTMPGLAGDKLSSEIIKIRRDIPIILCTGYSEHMSEEKAKEIGIRRFLQKPLDIKKFAETVRSVLDEKNG